MESITDKKVTCCFTGHRAAKLPWGFDESDGRCIELKRKIADAVEAVYRSGVRRFICGMASGCDIYFGEAVLSLRSREHDVELEAAIPYEGQASGWDEELRERYYLLVDLSDYRTVVAACYTPDCMKRRNRYMVDASSVLIACYDGKPGGTMSTMLYAMRQGLEIIEIKV